MIIYKTTNLINGKIYIGQDSHNNKKYIGSGIYLLNAIKKYGKENFIKEILCECFSKEELDEREKYYIKFYNSKIPSGYNISNGGEASWNIGLTKEVDGRLFHSLETRKKISESRMGDKNWSKRPEMREFHRNQMLQNNPMNNLENRKKISGKLKGKKKIYTEEGLKKKTESARKLILENNPMKNLEIREKHLTIVKSEKYRKNMSDVTSGEKNGMYGKKHSTETIDKIRKKAKEWWEKKREDERRNNIESDLG
jgi:group I intron endonuclease